MSFFDDNEIGSVGTINIEAAEGYSGAIGAQLAMVEGFQNDLSMFTAALKTDIKEARMVREGAEESAISAYQEGALGNFWNRLKEIVRKLIAKVKSIFNGFAAKFQAWMGKDGRAFFEKYKTDIFSGKDLDGLKVRYAKPKRDVSTIKVQLKSNFLKDNIGDNTEHSDLVKQYLGEITDPSVKAEPKEFRKEFHEACFESEEQTELKSGEIAEYVAYISGKKDPIAAIKKIAEAQEKSLNGVLKDIESFSKAATDNSVATANGTDKEKATASQGQKVAANYNKQFTAMQEALNIANSAALTEIKFAVAQSRRVAAAIVAYRGKKHEDADLLLDVEQEAAEYEVLSALEAVC